MGRRPTRSSNCSVEDLVSNVTISLGETTHSKGMFVDVGGVKIEGLKSVDIRMDAEDPDVRIATIEVSLPNVVSETGGSFSEKIVSLAH